MERMRSKVGDAPIGRGRSAASVPDASLLIFLNINRGRLLGAYQWGRLTGTTTRNRKRGLKYRWDFSPNFDLDHVA